MANDYIVEDSGIHRGMKWCATLNCMGFRCGYVGVTKTSKFWGIDYNDLYKKYKWPDVYGGLTYSSKKADDGYPIETCDGTWWFGFDCAHCYDGYDWDAALEKMPEHSDSIIFFKEHDTYNPPYPPKSLDFVRNECWKMADWFSVNDEIGIIKEDGDFASLEEVFDELSKGLEEGD